MCKLNYSVMPKNSKIVVDIEVIEDISRCTRILLEIVIAKKSTLTDEEIERLRYVNKTMASCNKLFQNAKPFNNE